MNWLAHIRKRSQLLRLESWKLELPRPSDLGGPLAEVSYDYQYLNATLDTDRLLALKPSLTQRETLTHELLHLALAPLTEAAGQAVGALEAFSGKAAEVYREQLELREEQVTETLARAIEELASAKRA